MTYICLKKFRFLHINKYKKMHKIRIFNLKFYLLIKFGYLHLCAKYKNEDNRL